MVQSQGPKVALSKFPVMSESSSPDERELRARAFMGRHRRRLVYLLHVPEFEELFPLGLEELTLPGASQGINLRGRLDALPLTHKYQLLVWVLEHFRGQLPTRVATRIAQDWGLDLPAFQEMDTHLADRVWIPFEEELVLQLGVQNRRYQEHQGYLFNRYQHLVDRVVRRVVFDRGRHADAIQEGALGLLMAIDRISEDVEQGFVTYAQSWIHRMVKKFLVRERFVVHVPVNLANQALSKGADASSPAPEGSAEAAARLLLQSPVFLDAPLEVGEPSRDLVDPGTAENRSGVAPDLRDVVRRGLATLTPKQREVIEARFGLLDPEAGPQTLEAISRRIGITHQQVSQREKRGLQKLAKSLRPMLKEIYG